MRGNVAFLASFNVLYLVGSLEKLHTHTHTHTHTHNADVSKPRFFLRARVEQNNLFPASRQAAGSNALCPFANSKSINIFTKRALLSSLYLTHFRSHWSGTESGAFNYFTIMRKKEFKKQPYVSPLCKVLKLESESFICVSVRPNAGGSYTDPNYDNKGEHDAGTIFFGDKSTVAPAKQGDIWDEEENF